MNILSQGYQPARAILVIFTKIILLLYSFLKIIARTALPLYCRKLVLNKPEILAEKGPLLLACNHPNSFLDSVILNTIFHEPVWSLARGDVFKKPFYIKLLGRLKILPVYRTSEGVENLSENYKTFDECIALFRKNAVVTIFSEGKCINEWHLRPLKKGTARLATKAWEEGIPLKVLPVGINYSSFNRFGKNMFINFGDIITMQSVDMRLPDGARHLQFNNMLKSELEKLVWEIPLQDKKQQEEKLVVRISLMKKTLLALPAAAGWLLHIPLFLPLKQFTVRKTKQNDHYDSLIVALHFFAYPVYLLLVTGLVVFLTFNWWSLLLLIALPFTAWSFVQLKPQLDN